MFVHRVRDHIAPALQRFLVLAFDEQTRLWFRAGIAQQYTAAVVLQFGFGLVNEIQDAVKLLDATLKEEAQTDEDLTKLADNSANQKAAA